MRILNVSPRVSSLAVGGSQRRMAGLLDRLGERHEVIHFCQPRLDELAAPAASRERIHRSRAAAAFTELGERTWLTSPVLSGAALRLTGTGGLPSLLRWSDVAMIEFPWQFDAVARLAPDAPLVLSAHNIELQRFRSLAHAVRARLTRAPWLSYVERVERAAAERAAAVIAVSERDRAGLVERYGVDPQRVVVAPNGADPETVRPASPERRAAARRALGLGDRPVVLFAGADVTPNRVGLRWVLELARRTDRFTFLVVGRVGGRPRREGNVVVTGFVESFEPCLEAADLSVCPIEFGGGTKVKLIEALAAGLPTVAFEESILGFDVRDGEHLLVADKSAESLVDGLERLESDPALAARLGRAARQHVVDHHAWDDIAARVERTLVAVVEGAREAPPPPARALAS